jgi:hypothetical protein
MIGQHELQKTLLYLDMNVSAAIMTAMEDSSRIYDEVSSSSRGSSSLETEQ